MDIDTIVPGSFAKAEVLSSPPVSAPTITGFNSLFYDTMSPRRSSSDSPAGPLPKKRRSHSPESVHRAAVLDASSSPAPLSSPSQRKLERMASGPLLAAFSKPSLQGLGAPPSNSNKRTRRPVLSAMVSPSDAGHPQSAYPVLSSDEKKYEARGLPPPRRAFSAMLIPTGAEPSSDDGSSSLEGPDMSSPAQAYAKRQSIKTIRRCDGTDDFRPLTGATAMVKRDLDESPSAKFLSAGMPGFGDNEALGKILPCHRVREDGLMRINYQTVSAAVSYS
jgi:M-phase inducer tyrosine phosphatase